MITKIFLRLLASKLLWLLLIIGSGFTASHSIAQNGFLALEYSKPRFIDTSNGFETLPFGFIGLGQKDHDEYNSELISLKYFFRINHDSKEGFQLGVGLIRYTGTHSFFSSQRQTSGSFVVRDWKTDQKSDGLSLSFNKSFALWRTDKFGVYILTQADVNWMFHNRKNEELHHLQFYNSNEGEQVITNEYHKINTSSASNVVSRIGVGPEVRFNIKDSEFVIGALSHYWLTDYVRYSFGSEDGLYYFNDYSFVLKYGI